MDKAKKGILALNDIKGEESIRSERFNIYRNALSLYLKLCCVKVPKGTSGCKASNWFTKSQAQRLLLIFTFAFLNRQQIISLKLERAPRHRITAWDTEYEKYTTVNHCAVIHRACLTSCTCQNSVPPQTETPSRSFCSLLSSDLVLGGNSGQICFLSFITIRLSILYHTELRNERQTESSMAAEGRDLWRFLWNQTVVQCVSNMTYRCFSVRIMHQISTVPAVLVSAARSHSPRLIRIHFTSNPSCHRSPHKPTPSAY